MFVLIALEWLLLNMLFLLAVVASAVTVTDNSYHCRYHTAGSKNIAITMASIDNIDDGSSRNAISDFVAATNRWSRLHHRDHTIV